MRIISILIIFFVVSCTVNPIKPTPAKTKPHGFYGPENQYYYFTAAQVQRKKGNLDKAVVLLQKAIELDPNRFEGYTFGLALTPTDSHMDSWWVIFFYCHPCMLGGH